ncbi:MAG: hypothetical protein AB7I27_08155 [Bacteriovoracaceae bacterium]
MKFLFLASLLVPTIAFADLVNLSSSLYGGTLWVNEAPTAQLCFVQINNFQSLPSKGKHCSVINAQFLLNPEEAQPKDLEVELKSRKTNSEADFHKETTCAEVVSTVDSPQTVDRWGSEEKDLYNQIFNAKLKVNGKENHYTLVFNGSSKAPSHYMVYRLGWFKETRYECRDLKAF